MSQTRHASFAVVFAVLLTGCLGVHNGLPEERGPRNVQAHEREDKASPARWRQVLLGSPPRPLHVGYLRTVTEGLARGSHVVYDTQFKVIGRISANGMTTRITSRGEERVGGFAVPHALLRLHMRSKGTEVSLKPMPAPRG